MGSAPVGRMWEEGCFFVFLSFGVVNLCFSPNLSIDMLLDSTLEVLFLVKRKGHVL